ncbi:hypothetical protein F8B43_2159 [Methylorubrum populi]|uniref:Uncharacterized protein n=1 Tax=Methylorubrum populi TaxID=223967 RepID=A0A833J6T0_9HYPH|nr:hypothetical protein F8B43_2159 [Methylorubrum populi]
MTEPTLPRRSAPLRWIESRFRVEARGFGDRRQTDTGTTP